MPGDSFDSSRNRYCVEEMRGGSKHGVCCGCQSLDSPSPPKCFTVLASTTLYACGRDRWAMARRDAKMDGRSEDRLLCP